MTPIFRDILFGLLLGVVAAAAVRHLHAPSPAPRGVYQSTITEDPLTATTAAQLAAIHQRLQSHIGPISCNKVPARNFLVHLQRQVGVDLRPRWVYLVQENINFEAPVTLNLNNPTAHQALTAFLIQLAGGKANVIDYQIANGAIEIAPISKSRHQQITRVYDVQDLIKKSVASRAQAYIEAEKTYYVSRARALKTAALSPGPSDSDPVVCGRNPNPDPGPKPTLAQLESDVANKLIGDLQNAVPNALYPAQASYFAGKLIVTEPIQIHEIIADTLRQMRAPRP